MNILQIVLTNTSTIDTSLPFLWAVKQKYPNSRITILYCVGNKKQVLRDSAFVDEFCNKLGIDQIDLSDFLSLPKIGKKLWRYFFKYSTNDNYPIRKLLQQPSLLFKGRHLSYIGMAFRKKIETALGNSLVRLKDIDKIIQPDIVLFDLRQKTRFYGRNQLFQYFYENKPITVLLPHSPHDITPYSEITSFDEKGYFFPDFCKYWIAFKHSRAFEKFPGRSDDFLYCGYSAFDSRWLAFNKNNASVRTKKRCLILIRNFYPENVNVPEGEWFTVSYESNLIYLNRVADAVNRVDLPIEFVIKPHPKASLPKTKELIESTNLKNWVISYESFYEQIKDIDFVISTFTTSLLIPQMSGIPTILVEDYVQQYVHNWNVLKEMYKGLSLYSSPEDDLQKKINQALMEYNPDDDINHLRQYFPDNNLDYTLNMFEKLMHEKKN
jgi:hypothetical protein